jgi:hypothetical protein
MAALITMCYDITMMYVTSNFCTPMVDAVRECCPLLFHCSPMRAFWKKRKGNWGRDADMRVVYFFMVISLFNCDIFVDYSARSSSSCRVLDEAEKRVWGAHLFFVFLA